jgi:hypothetical protein
VATETEEWIASWKRRKVKGVWLYLLEWVLVFALTGILFSAIDWFMDDKPFNFIRLATKSVFAGLSVGAFFWILNAYRYNKSKGTDSVSDT